MHVRELELAGFMSHTNTTLSFPRKGIVLISGENGQGKSAIAEGLAFGFFGKTLRGEGHKSYSPWSGDTGKVRVSTWEGLEIARVRKKGKVTLAYSEPENAATKHATASKAGDDLESVVMGWDVWRRAFAFSSSDAQYFSQATDGEQKRLIEGIIGLEVFDPALKACRVDLATRENEVARAETALERIRLKLESERRRLQEAKGYVDAPAPTGAPIKNAAARKSKLDEAIQGASIQLRDLRSQRSAKTLDDGTMRARIAALRDTVDVLQADVCPTCHQTIKPELRAQLSEELRNATEQAEGASIAARNACGDIDAQIAELDEELAELRTQQSAVQTTLMREQDAAGRARQNASILQEASEAIGKLEAEQKTEQDRLSGLRATLAEIKAAELVLGLRGARTGVLANALRGLDAVASSWLARIAGQGIRLKLQAFTETKTAGVNDAFSMTIEGAGGGHGYHGSSQGQRRRIDVALMFALGEVAAGARGVESATMVVDEVFDSLDAPGVAAVTAALQELAQDRCVIVISHNSEIITALSAVDWWKVHDGQVSRA